MRAFPRRFTIAAAFLGCVAFQLAANAGPLRTGTFTLTTKFTVELAGQVVGSIISVDGLEHSHETVGYKDPEGQGSGRRINIIRVWSHDTPRLPVDTAGAPAPVAVSVVADDDAGEEIADINLTGCLPAADRYAWRFNALGLPEIIEDLEMRCESMTVTRGASEPPSTAP